MRPTGCLPSEVLANTRLRVCVAGRSSGLRTFRLSLIFYWPRLPNPDGSVPCYGFRVSLTAAGQPRILTGFPLMRQSAHQQQRQHMMWFMMVSTQNIVGDVEIHY